MKYSIATDAIFLGGSLLEASSKFVFFNDINGAKDSLVATGIYFFKVFEKGYTSLEKPEKYERNANLIDGLMAFGSMTCVFQGNSSISMALLPYVSCAEICGRNI